MAINFICRCGKKLCLSDALAGNKIMCPACKKWATVPDPTQAVEIAPAEEFQQAMMISTVHDSNDSVAEEEPELIPLDADEEKTSPYAMNAKDAKLKSRLRGAPSLDDMQFAGELECVTVSRDNFQAQCLAYSPDERQALAGLGQTVHVLDVKQGKKVGKFREHLETLVTAVAYSPDSRFALSGDDRGGIALWEVAGTRLIKWLDGHRGDVTCLAFPADGRRALSSGADGRLFLWDLRSGEIITRLKEGTNPINCMALSRDGRRALSAGESGSVRYWDLEKARLICSLHGASGPLTAAALSADGESAYVARSKSLSKGGLAVWRWDLRTRKSRVCFDTPTRHLAEINCVVLSPDGERLVSAGVVRGIMERGTIAGHMGPDPGLLDAGVGLGKLGLDVRDTFFRMRHVIQVWTLATGHVLHTLQGHEGKIGCLAFSPDGHRFLSSGKDGTVRAWQIP
jgi:WD40 repeat protein